MLKKDKAKLAVLVSASLSASVAMTSATASPFSVSDLAQGYNLAQFDGEGKCGESKKDGKEGKCGEGKCGESKGKKGKEGKCGEGKCGESKGKKGKEGKCGEGKCGESKKGKEGKCGEGKCGG